MTSGSATRQHAREARARLLEGERRRNRRSTLIRSLTVLGVVLLVAGIVGVAMYTSRPAETAVARSAPDFTLTDTTGVTHALSDYRGQNVILYFSEGAGCQSCLVQMGQIEKMVDRFKAANITVLPIVMNTKDQITADMRANGVTTPFLLDDGTVSTAYGTIGKGMHAGLPGHSFVVIDAQGMQRWYGEYPGMWLEPSELLIQATTALSS